jgi:hypothetical protein
MALRGDYVRTKGCADFGKSWLAGLDNLTSDEVGIDHAKAALLQKAGGSGLAHTDAARKPQKRHKGEGCYG